MHDMINAPPPPPHPPPLNILCFPHLGCPGIRVQQLLLVCLEELVDILDPQNIGKISPGSFVIDRLPG